MSGGLEQYYNKKAIILIDEYDVPLEYAFVRGFYDEMVDFMRKAVCKPLCIRRTL